MIFGINDGGFILQHTRFPDNNEELNEVQNLGCNAVEVRLYEESRKAIMAMDMSDFKWRSIHIEKISFLEDDAYWEYLDFLDGIVREKNIQNVVFHSRWLKNLDDLKKYPNTPWAVENMGILDREDSFVDGIKKILNVDPELKLVLDVRHTLSIDPSGKLLLDFWNEFESRISEIHISDGGDNVTPCFKVCNRIIEDFLRINTKPVIIESIYADKEEMIKEIEYVKGLLG